MMDDDRPFVTAGCIADPAATAVTFENRFSQTTKVLLVLALQRVAG